MTEIRPDQGDETALAVKIGRAVRARFEIYATLAKWPVLVVWWAAAATAAAAVLINDAGLAVALHACASPFCDFSGFWEAGYLAAVGHAAANYDEHKFMALRHALFGTGVDPRDWLYPPPALLPLLGLSRLSLSAGFFVWLIGLTVVAVLLLRSARVTLAVLTAGLLSPAGLWNLELGQFGGLTGAAFITALMAPRALSAGLGAAMLILKPQAGLLVPIVWCVERRWRAIAAAAIVGVFLIAASVAIVGANAWVSYFTLGLAQSRATLVAVSIVPGTAEFSVSIFGMLRSLGAGPGSAGAGQIIGSLLAFGSAVWLWRNVIGGPQRVLLTTILALLATPYGYVDDMVGVSLALALCAQARGWRFSLTDAILFTWPALCPVVYGITGLQVTPLLLGFALWRNGVATRLETPPVSAGRAAGRPAVG